MYIRSFPARCLRILSAFKGASSSERNLASPPTTTLQLTSSPFRCYEKGLHSDVTLLAPNGNRMLAHQAILAVSSTRFASILADGKFTQKELPVQGVDSLALESVIRFFYTGECQLQAGSAIAVLDAAIKLEAKGLAAHVEGYINQVNLRSHLQLIGKPSW
jgi:hypothetical protein